MANLPPVSVLGPEGPPPMKKMRTDSDSDVMSLLDNFNDELPEDLISGDLRIGDSPMLNSSETSNNLIQQGSPVPNSNTLNQRPPLSSPQPPPSSISTSGDPTPTMPCVSSTPANNTPASMAVFNSNQRNSLQMMSLPSSGSTNQQMPDHSVPTNSHYASSSYNSMSGSPHPSMGHMDGPHISPHMQHVRMRHGGGIGPMRVGMPNQPHTMMHPGMSPHHGGIPRPGMGGMVSHQPVAHRMGTVPMAGGPQYMHQHPSGHHGMHPMVNPGMPNQQMGGPQNMHMMPTAPMHGSMRPNMIHHGANQAHMSNTAPMHGSMRPNMIHHGANQPHMSNMHEGQNPQSVSTGGAANSIPPGTPQSSGPGSASTTPNSQQQQSTPSTTPPVGIASVGSGLTGIASTLDTQPQTPQQLGVSETSSQVNPTPNTMTTPPNQGMQNLQTSQAMGGQGGGRVPTPPPPGGGAGGINASGGQPSAGFQPGMGGKPQQQAPGSTSDPEKRKQIQQQLVLLLHAHKCQRREQEQNMGGDYTACSLPHCRTMKNVLNHMTLCQAGRNCQYPHCASSRQIITHWKNCHRSDCPVCLPLKQTSLQNKRGTGPDPNNQSRVQSGGMGPGVGMGGPVGGMGGPSSSSVGGPSGSQGMNMRQGGMAGGGAGFGMQNPSGHGGFSMMGAMSGGNRGMIQQQGPVANYGGPAGGMPPSMAQPTYPLPIPQIASAPTQPWHDEVNPDLRQHLVRKLVEAIYPVHDPIALQDKRVYSLIQYAMKVEKTMFDTASSREDYYKLLAQKIYQIRKELEDRKKKKVQINGDINMPPTSGNMNIFGSPQPSQPMQVQPQQQMMRAPPPMQGGVANNYNLAPSFSNASTSGSTPSGVPPAHSPIPTTISSELNSVGVAGGNPPSISSPLPSVDSKKDIFQNKLLSPLSSGYHGSSNATSAQNSDSVMPQSGGLPSLPSGKMNIKEEPVSSMSHMTTSPSHPPPSAEMPSVHSLPSIDSKKDIFPSKVATPPSSGSFQEVVLPSQSADPLLQPGGVPSLSEPKSTSAGPSNQKIVPNPSLLKVFSKEELVGTLMHVFDLLWRQDPESFPFRQPVDPKALGIPDYFEIIKNPIDLTTIRNRLENGEYKNGWEFCTDVYLMFDNAWSYNRKTSRVYRYCTKLSEVFEATINEAMQSLGYCCGYRYTFHPQVLYCYGKPLCTIPRDSLYYGYQNRYVYCGKCFGEILGDTITVGDDPLTATIIPKSQFKEMKNNSIDREGMVDCVHCRRQMHSICTLHFENIWNKGFQCESCLKALKTNKKENKYSAKRLPTTKLSAFLEERVTKFIRSSDATEAGPITIRVVSSSDKTLETRMLMKERYLGEFPEQFPYRSKAMFVFEEIDGVDVCFFGMHVQEYGSDCQAPNTRRVYISYLDSIHFFQPRALRTDVYHEILIGYLDFCKMNGFMTAHIWACPPSEGDDYIFHCHPDEQKIPKPKRLTDWYRKMLDRGKSDNVVHEYRDIFKHSTEEGITSVTEIPYFDGDFWPNVIEETIKELDQEAKQREASVKGTEGRAPKKADKRNKGSKKTGTRSKSSKKGNVVVGGDDLSTKVYQTMDKHKEVFFTVLLNPPSSISSPLPGTTDPDNLIMCDLMDGRDAFLTMARERHWEFSSLRRAKYSSMAMLYELHTQAGDRFVYNCNNCRMAVETRYHCRECDDFDLCVSCHKEVPHPHPMDMLGLGLELDTQSQDQSSHKDPKEQRKASIEKCIRFLVHATQCHNVHCKQPSCIKMKRVLTHTRDCKLMLSGRWNQCNVCKQFVLLCISHAKSCNVDKCPVPVCARIKKNLRDQRNQRRVQQNRFMQQRMAQMNSALNSVPAPPVPVVPAAVPTSQAGGASAPSPAPSSTSPNNHTSISSPTKAKGSPATHTSNPASNKPYINAPSPAPGGPHSAGKGGPRTPTTGKSAMIANSPSVHGHMSPSPVVKPEVLQGYQADEHKIRRVGPGPNDPRQQQAQPSGQVMMNHPSMNHMAGYGGNPMSVSQIQPTNNPMVRVQQQQQHMAGMGGNYLTPHSHQAAMMRQHMRNQMLAAQHGASATPFAPQQHPSQLERILTSPQHHHPQYNQGYMPGTGDPHHTQYQQQGYMPTQMNPGTHPSLGPPPQYPANRQPAAYSQMPIVGSRPGMGPGGAGMQMGPGGGGYMYNANTNSNNNSVCLSEVGFHSLPPQDKLSRFVEHL